MKKFTIVLTLLFLSSCSALMDGITGNYSKFDANEYQHSVELQIVIDDGANLCQKPTLFRYQLNKIDGKLRILNLYSSGKPNNKRVTNQVNLIEESLDLIKKKKKISSFYCEQKIKNLQTMSDTLRKSIGEKKHD